MLELRKTTYVTTIPSEQNMLDLFEGEWSSLFPPPHSHLRAGTIPLFQDSRIHWMIQELGGIEGFRILELGPLEAGHSYMMDRAGAASITAIEANPRAFLKCLTAKQVLGMPKAEFALGDFRELLAVTQDRWDLCVASGVLYHMREPVELLKSIGEHADRVFLWTHYYDEAIVRGNPNLRRRFDGTVPRETGGLSYTLHQLSYMGASKSKAFRGGSAQFSQWLTRGKILEALRHFGFENFSIGHETPNHPNGPAFAVLATRVR